MMRARWLAAWSCGICVAAQSLAATLPSPGTPDSRIRMVQYQPNDVIDLVGFVGYHLDLEFSEGEEFVGLSAGDPEALTYSAHGNVLTLKPRVVSALMNLTVSTSKRRYYFDYAIQGHTPNRMRDPVMYVVRFRYPPEGPTAEARIAADFASARAVRPLNRDYWFCGDRAVKPVSASDDGVQTRLTFAPRRDLPAVFIANEDGSEALVNFTVEADSLVIHRVAPRLVLRRGRLVGCVVNRSFAGGSDSLDSGTVAPDVLRQRKAPEAPR